MIPRPIPRVLALLALAPALALGQETRPVPEGGETAGPSSAALWVANLLDGTVSVLSHPSGETRAVVPVDAGPVALAAPPGGDRVFVACHTGATLAVVDRGSLRRTGTVRLGSQPYWVEATPDGRRVWVAITGESHLLAVDAATAAVVGSVQVGAAPVVARVAPGGLLLAACSGSNELAVVDLERESLLALIEVGERPVWVEPAPDGRTAYVACAGAGAVSVVDLVRRRAVRTLAVGGIPTGLAWTPEGGLLVIDHQPGAGLRAHDPATGARLRDYPGGNDPIGVLVHAGRALVSDVVGNRVLEVDLASGAVAREHGVGRGPRGLLLLGPVGSDRATSARPPVEPAPAHASSPRPARPLVRGTLRYSGTATGVARVVLHRSEPPNGPPVGLVSLPAQAFPLSFELRVPGPGTYYLRAFLDVDPSGGTHPDRARDPSSDPARTPPLVVDPSGLSEALEVWLHEPPGGGAQ